MRPIPKSRIQENLYTNSTSIGSNIALRYISDKKPYIYIVSLLYSCTYVIQHVVMCWWRIWDFDGTWKHELVYCCIPTGVNKRRW